MLYFFHHYELPLILRQIQLQNILNRTTPITIPATPPSGGGGGGGGGGGEGDSNSTHAASTNPATTPPPNETDADAESRSDSEAESSPDAGLPPVEDDDYIDTAPDETQQPLSEII